MEKADIPIKPGQHQQVPLPNSSIVLVFGIVSVVLCWCLGMVSLVMAIIALVLSKRDLRIYQANPGAYTPHSYSNIRAGRNIAIIGLVLSVVFIFFFIIALLFLGLNLALFAW